MVCSKNNYKPCSKFNYKRMVCFWIYSCFITFYHHAIGVNPGRVRMRVSMDSLESG